MSYRVALLPEHFKWAGGLDFLRHILNGLIAVKASHNVSVIVAVEVSFLDTGLYRQFQDFISHTGNNGIEQITYQAWNSDLAEVLLAHQIDIILPVNADLGAHFPVPWVAYIPDFQHKYLFNNFSEQECFQRETAFAARLRDCTAMLVNSAAVKNDITTFYPWINAERVSALPYTPGPMPEWLALESKPVQQKFGIDKAYFIMCNQFWLHKEHKTAIEAFAKLHDASLELVCTGTMEDYRDPGYIDSIKQLVATLKISTRVKFLGHVSKAEQIGLLKGARALIQPTLFEGGPGGGAVYDAVALDVPVIISDIAVNQEVNARHLTFFEAGSVTGLADAMRNYSQPTVRLDDKALIETGYANREKLGLALIDIIEYTLSCYQAT